jgi:hypothetical protein
MPGEEKPLRLFTLLQTVLRSEESSIAWLQEM